MKKLLLSILIISPFLANAQFWTEKATGFTTPNRSLHSISIVDTNTIWALAADFSVDPVDLTIKEFTKSTNGGNTWTVGTIDLGPNTDELGISSITAVSTTTAWVTAYPDKAGTTQFGGIWKTTDGGLTWTKQASALFNSNDSYTNFVYFWDANNGVTQGDPENGEFEIYTTTDGGTNWTRVNGTNLPDPDINGEYGYENLYSVSGNTIWFGTDRGRLFKSVDKGLNWTVYQTPSTSFEYDNFTFSDNLKGLISIYASPIVLYNTVDGGANWNQVTSTGTYNTDISYIPNSSTVVAGDWKNPKGSSYSLNDGATWTYIDAVPHGTMKFLNSTLGFSGGFNTDATTGGVFKYTGTVLKTSSYTTSNTISTYPNPTNGLIHIDNGNTAINQVSVFDLLGRQVLDSKITPSTKTDLDLKSLQAGEYLIKVTSDSGKTGTKKILKK